MANSEWATGLKCLLLLLKEEKEAINLGGGCGGSTAKKQTMEEHKHLARGEEKNRDGKRQRLNWAHTHCNSGASTENKQARQIGRQINLEQEKSRRREGTAAQRAQLNLKVPPLLPFVEAVADL